MKKKIQICALTLFLALCSYGQPYESVISTDSTSWDIAWKELFGNIMGELYTVINKDSVYHDLFFQNPFPNPAYVGKIREDSVSGKVWFVPPEKDEEYLIMDMTLNVGDTFHLPVFNTIVPIVAVDVFYLNQRKCIEFDFQTEWDEPLRFIEGVGRNIAMQQFWYGDFTYVACKYNAGELVYANSNPNFIECELDPARINPVHSNPVRVYPNPVSELLHVACEGWDCQYMTISIFNINGLEVYYNNFANCHTTIDLNTFNNGFYFMKIFYNNNFKNIKLIKQ